MSRQNVSACNPTGSGFDLPNVAGRGFGSTLLQMGSQIRNCTRQLKNGFRGVESFIRRDYFCEMPSKDVATKLRR